MQAIVSINGAVPPAEPMSMTIGKNDVYSDSSGRSTETGTMLLYPIRMGVYTLELEYILDTEQCKLLEQMISAAEMTVKFYDGDDLKTAKMYASASRTKEVLGTADFRKYRLSFSLIEL